METILEVIKQIREYLIDELGESEDDVNQFIIYNMRIILSDPNELLGAKERVLFMYNKHKKRLEGL